MSDHAVPHHQTQELEGRERRDSTGGISEGNKRSILPQRLEPIVESGHRDQYAE